MAIFHDGGRCHLGFLELQIFNGRNNQEGQNESSCQISLKLLELRPRYGDFSIFLKMATAIIFDFNSFTFLTVGTVKKVELHHCAKFRRNRLHRSRDMVIFQFFKIAAATFFDVRNFNV